MGYFLIIIRKVFHGGKHDVNLKLFLNIYITKLIFCLRG